MSYSRVSVGSFLNLDGVTMQRFMFYDEAGNLASVKVQEPKPATTAIAPWNRKVPNGNRRGRRT